MTNFPGGFSLGDLGLPAPPWVFIAVLLLIFFLHLLSMWLLFGGLIVGLSELAKSNLNWRETKALRYLPIIMALVINLGVPPLLSLQVVYPAFFLTSSVIMAVPWIGVFFLLMISYGMIYAARYGAKEKWQAILFLVISTISALWISFTFTNNVSLMIKPEYWQQLYSYKQNGLNLYPNLQEVLARWVWVLAPIFVAGTALLNRSRNWLLPSAIAGIAGLLVYKGFLSPETLKHSLVQYGSIIDLILSAALILIFFVFSKSNTLFRPVLFTWLAVKGLAVLAVRHGIRASILDPIYPLANLPVQFQPFLISIFIISLLVGLAAIGWMIVKGRKELTI